MGSEIFYIISLITSLSVTLLMVLAAVCTAIVVAVCLRRAFRRYLVRKSDKYEIWLPVVDDAGHVMGRVAQSVSEETPGNFQHPLIRMLVRYNKMLYLQPRSEHALFEPETTDIPIEVLMQYGDNIDDTLLKVRDAYFPDSPKPRFLLKYQYENQEGKWLVLLYIIEVSDRKQLKLIKHEGH